MFRLGCGCKTDPITWAIMKVCLCTGNIRLYDTIHARLSKT